MPPHLCPPTRRAARLTALACAVLPLAAHAQPSPANDSPPAEHAAPTPPPAGPALHTTPTHVHLLWHDGAGGTVPLASWEDTPDDTWVVAIEPNDTGSPAVVRWEPPPGQGCGAPSLRVQRAVFDPTAATFLPAPAPPDSLAAATPLPATSVAASPEAPPHRRVWTATRAGTSDAWARDGVLEGVATGPPWRPARGGDDASLLVRTHAGLPATHLVLDLDPQSPPVLAVLRDAAAPRATLLSPPGRWQIPLPTPSACALVTLHVPTGSPPPRVRAAWLDGGLVAPGVGPHAESIEPALLHTWLTAPAALTDPDTPTLLAHIWAHAPHAVLASLANLPPVAQDAVHDALIAANAPPAAWLHADLPGIERLATRLHAPAPARDLSPIDDWVRLLTDPSAHVRGVSRGVLLQAHRLPSHAVQALVSSLPTTDSARTLPRLILAAGGSPPIEAALLPLVSHPDHVDAALRTAALLPAPLTDPGWTATLLHLFDDEVGTRARIAIALAPRLAPPLRTAELVEALQRLAASDPHPMLRAQAVTSLLDPAFLPSANARAAVFERAIEDVEPEVRRAAALGCADAEIHDVVSWDAVWERIGATRDGATNDEAGTNGEWWEVRDALGGPDRPGCRGRVR